MNSIVIGSGFGGIAAALRLKAKGYNVTLIEKHPDLGGRARVFSKNGFIFDGGPTVITAPYLINEEFEMYKNKLNLLNPNDLKLWKINQAIPSLEMEINGKNNPLELGLKDLIDFKKGCYVGQENTARIKLKNKLSKRLFPIEIIDGKLNENDAIFANDTEIGKVLINDDYPFALIKFLDKNFDKNKIFKCKNGSIKVLIPDWLEISS